eukprot:48481_1
MPKRIHKERPDQLIRLHVAEPAPLGLFGLGMGCLILMFVDFEVTSGKLMLIPWIFLLPASLQFIAGIFDFMRHNVFGGTAFLGYSMVWYGLSAVYFLEIQYMYHPAKDILLPEDPLPSRQHFAIICIGYLIFSVMLTIVSCGINRILFFILASIDFTFLVLAIHIFEPEHCPSWIVGIGLLCVFLTSMYGFLAILILKVAGGEVFPIGAPFCKLMNHVIDDPMTPRDVPDSDEESDDEELVPRSGKKRKVKDQYYECVAMDQIDSHLISGEATSRVANDEKV